MNITRLATMIDSLDPDAASPAVWSAACRVRRANARLERLAILARVAGRGWSGATADVVTLLALLGDACTEHNCGGIESGARCLACQATRLTLARDARARDAIRDAQADAIFLARHAREAYEAALADRDPDDLL